MYGDGRIDKMKKNKNNTLGYGYYGLACLFVCFLFFVILFSVCYRHLTFGKRTQKLCEKSHKKLDGTK